MGLLSEQVQKQVRDMFAAIEGPVKIAFFTQGETPEGVPAIECGMCHDTHQLIEELAALSDKISLQVYDFVKDKEAAETYHIDKIPAMVVLGGEKDYGIRLYGIPSGYEFATLIEDIIMVSKGKTDLSEKTLKEIAKLNKPVHIQVYTTPT